MPESVMMLQQFIIQPRPRTSMQKNQHQNHPPKPANRAPRTPEIREPAPGSVDGVSQKDQRARAKTGGPAETLGGSEMGPGKPKRPHNERQGTMPRPTKQHRDCVETRPHSIQSRVGKPTQKQTCRHNYTNLLVRALLG